MFVSLFVTVRSLGLSIFGHDFGIVKNSPMRRDAQTLFHSIWTYSRKDIDFQSFYELKN